MRSHINNLQVEGHILNTPILRPDGHVEATLQSHEVWQDATGAVKSRENMLGLLALPETSSARWLKDAKPGTRILVIGSLRTHETPPGPRGGTTTKTKLRIRSLYLPV